MNKLYVCFENKGEVPINAFKLLGASTKRGDSSKIGYFGTGLKYAIAVMLKKGIDFKVYSGEKEVVIGVRKTKFIEDTVEVMTVNGEKTSITLDAGVDWEPWFAIREIYSNAIDENGTMTLNTPVEPKAGYTRIFIDSDSKELKSTFENWPAYFTHSRSPMFRNSRGSIYTKLPTVPEYVVFRKGIRAHESTKHSIFDYDVPDLKINESRVAIYAWEVHEKCSDLLASGSIEVVNEFLTLFKNPRRMDYVEWQDYFWDYAGFGSFSSAWLEALEEYRIVPQNFAGNYEITQTTIVLPDKLIKKLADRFGDALNFAGDNKDKFTIVDGVDKQPLQKMLDVFAHAGFNWELDKIDIVKFNDRDILGQAKDGRVLLSDKLFTPQHKHEVAATLLEEMVHAITGYDDCSRGLQNFLFNTITNMAKDAAAKKDGAAPMKQN